MTVTEYQNVLKNQIKILKSDKIMKLAVYSVNQRRIKRIFEDGKTSQGIQIGQYNDTTPVTISQEDAPKKIKIGGRYRSYKAFRIAMGRESNFVNIRLNNRLQSDLANATLSKATTKLADNNPIKVDNHKFIVTLKNQENINKIQFLEKKYGKIIDLTKGEISFYQDILEKEFRLALAK